MSRHTASIKSLTFDELDDWVTPSIAWQYLKVSKSHLYEMINSGALPAKRWGKRNLRIPKEALRPEVSTTTLPAA